jgi:hypothetical protein
VNVEALGGNRYLSLRKPPMPAAQSVDPPYLHWVSKPRSRQLLLAHRSARYLSAQRLPRCLP